MNIQRPLAHRMWAPPRRQTHAARRLVKGLSLIELMVAVVLGLLVVLAAIGLFTSNRAVYDSSEALARIQENARAGFELMARDIRGADGTACRAPVDPHTAAAGSAPEKLPLVRWLGGNVAPWRQLGDWGDGLVGSSGAQGDSIELRLATVGVVPITMHKDNTLFYAGSPRFTPDEPVVACDGNTGYLLRAVVVGQGSQVSYKMATCQIDPGSEGGISVRASSRAGAGGQIGGGMACEDDGNPAGLLIDPTRRPAFLAPVTAVRWEVDKNPRGGRSLYRLMPGVYGDDKAEVIDGVRSLKLRYLLPGNTEYVTAKQVGDDWKKVRAVRIALELEVSPGGGTGNEVGRRIVHVVSLRNRNP